MSESSNESPLPGKSDLDSIFQASAKAGFKAALIYLIGSCVLGFMFEIFAKNVFGVDKSTGQIGVWQISAGGLPGTTIRIWIFYAFLGPVYSFIKGKSNSLTQIQVFFLALLLAPLLMGLVPSIFSLATFELKYFYLIGALSAGHVVYADKYNKSGFFSFLLYVLVAWGICGSINSDIDAWSSALKIGHEFYYGGSPSVNFVICEIPHVILEAYIYFYLPQRLIKKIIFA